MQELVGRLTAVDAEATETLKVISYFDTLINGHAAAEAILRGAAILSGCPAGQSVDGRILRVDERGARAAPVRGDWPSRRFGDDGVAWIEREGAPHANDDMILERMAIALGVAQERTSPVAATRRALETVIDEHASAESRAEAIQRLHLDPHASYRVVATTDPHAGRATSVVVGTTRGPVRVTLGRDAAAWQRAGIGILTPPQELPLSWSSAECALRLTTTAQPVIDADDLGALRALGTVPEAHLRELSDVAAMIDLIASHAGAEPLLDAVAASDSLRGAGTTVGLHHSTVQARVAHYSDALGFDLRSPRGRVRLSLALAAYRLASTRFE